jgi:hypothetical protein
VRVNFAGQKGQSLVWGSCGTFPLCERMRETVPSFLYSTLAAIVGGGGMDIAGFWSGATADGIFVSEGPVVDVEEKERPRSQNSEVQVKASLGR